MVNDPLKRTINAKGQLLDLSAPKIMGILNLTPDSFFDGGRYTSYEKSVNRAKVLWEEGADIIDVGAYSTRPGAKMVGEQEEIDRLMPIIEWMHVHLPGAIVSVDTFRASVASAAVAGGAAMINDISGGNLDSDMLPTVGKLEVPYILMHMRGRPENMQELTDYDDLIFEMTAYFRDKIQALRAVGVKDIILDPGFGFAKTLKQNYELLRRLDSFFMFDLPILGAVSRKSMIYKTLGITPETALNGTTVLNTALLSKGVQLLRVHDVRAAKEAARLVQLMLKG